MPIAIPSANSDTSPNTSITTPPTQAPKHEDLVEAILDPVDNITADFIDSSSLIPTNVKNDPILSPTAQKQVQATVKNTAKGGFMAKPAPNSTYKENAGPRMTKTTALRLGLKWEDVKPKREVTGKSEEGKGTPEYKRNGLNIKVPSLAAPSVTPRPTRTSQLRTGVQLAPQRIRKDPQEMAAANKSREMEERERRRKDTARPTSLAPPSITPRQNKSSMLRTGIKPPQSLSSVPFARQSMSLAGHSEKVNEKGGDEGVKPRLPRRSEITPLKSLGTPCITPRLNKAALLRTPHSFHSSTSHSPSPLSFQPRGHSPTSSKLSNPRSSFAASGVTNRTSTQSATSKEMPASRT
ncbi:hypothetical protein AYX14_02906 [Cryptococcus neoformans]|nr:hypothetical protein AYX15_02319 [Cryptococcus neoformans var. grubii]OWZ71714.1 hypothetical protein AYX14_02906 [Cryptococcus neoformans var. grubii]